MMANEVIANRGLEILGYKKGEYDHLHPNDHVNCSQSTNDAYPTAIKLAVLLSLKDLLGAMDELKAALEAKAEEFSDVLKMGRTENQDAVPMTLGQDFQRLCGHDRERRRRPQAYRRRISQHQHGRHGYRYRHQQPAGVRRPGNPKTVRCQRL
jgi:aspartate ammonia-lyase